MLLLKQGLSAQSSRFLGLQQSSRNQDVHVLLLSVFEMSQFIFDRTCCQAQHQEIEMTSFSPVDLYFTAELGFLKKKILEWVDFAPLCFK